MIKAIKSLINMLERIKNAVDTAVTVALISVALIGTLVL
jgi:hypothetical protein